LLIDVSWQIGNKIMMMSLSPKVTRGHNFKMHLGCGDQPIPAWINTDITPHIFVARIPGLPFLLHKAGLLTHERYQQHRNNIFKSVFYLNATAKFPFEKSTVDYVFCSHFLEHLYPERAQFCIAEVLRI